MEGAATLPAPTPSSIVFTVGDPIGRADIPRLCDALLRLLEGSDAKVVVCDLSPLVRPDAVTVDALARLQLTARRRDCQIRLRHASDELRDLLTFTGLCATFTERCAPGISGVGGCLATRRG